MPELRTGHEDGTHWVPAEVDVSIRPGWYYHPSEDHKVKTLPHLLDIYYNSIGRNASFLLNFPVDTRGLIHEKDVEQVMKLADAIAADFANNLALGKRVTATNIRGNSRKYKAQNVTDGNPDTYWAADDNIIESSLEINFKKPTEMNRFLVQEDIRLGQRVKKFKLDALIDNEWESIASETTIGRKRILRFPNVTATKLRLTIEDAKASPVISNIEVYLAPKILIEPEIRRNKNGLVSIKAFDEGLQIYYTLDGTKPSATSSHYEREFEWKEKGAIKAMVVDPTSGESSSVAVEEFDIVKEKWKVAGDFALVKETENIFDGNENLAWNIDQKPPVDIIIDLGETLSQLAGLLIFLTRAAGIPGIIFNYEFFVSEDGKNWGIPVSSGRVFKH
jgi:alpha-L-fucosidase